MVAEDSIWIIPIRDAWLAYARPMCALSLRADIDGWDSLDGYRNGSPYYQGIAHEVLIRAVAATVMSVQGQFRKSDCATAMSAFPPLATELRTSLEVRFVKRTDIAPYSITSVVRVHQHGVCIADNNHQDMGRSRGGLTSKIHAVIDTNGLRSISLSRPVRRATLALVSPILR